MRVAGLDLSTKRSGYCAPNGTLHSVTAHAGPEDPARRVNEIKRALWRVIRCNPPLPELVVIEDYSLGSPGVISKFRLGELAGVIKDLMFEEDIPFTLVRPSSLKLFATGKTGADKTLMAHAATSRILAVDRCAPGPRNDDEADAFHLRRMGRVALGVDEVLATWERAAIDGAGLIWGRG